MCRCDCLIDFVLFGLFFIPWVSGTAEQPTAEQQNEMHDLRQDWMQIISFSIHLRLFGGKAAPVGPFFSADWISTDRACIRDPCPFGTHRPLFLTI